MYKSALFFLLWLGVFIYPQNGEAKIIHAILVADTVNDIIFNARADLHKMREELSGIAKHTQSTLKERIFSGGEFKKEKVIDYLRDLTLAPSDTIIFYFSGHGYRDKQKQTPWPDLAFELYKPGVDLQWIAQTIWNKKPQFALIFADCCNNYLERGFNNALKTVVINLHKIPTCTKGYQQLFTNAKGCVVICSSSAGQFSYVSEDGGLFTLCFLSSLNKEVAQPKPSWKKLLERAHSYIGHIQKPCCEVYR
jgi:caspase domain-containing protein